jgi:hypothetical protein
VPLSSLLAAPKLLPADVLLFALINTEIQDLADIAPLDDVEDELGISFKDDIEPWLGSELAIAVTGMEGILTGIADEPNIIVLAATKDTEASDAFLEKVLAGFKDQGVEVGEEIYADVTYYVEEETPLVFGTVDPFVILTTNQDAMAGVIDVAQGRADSQADDGRYTKSLDALPGGAAAYAFLNLGDVIETILDLGEAELPVESFEQLIVIETLGVAVSPDQEGTMLNLALGFDPDALPPGTLENMAAKASAHRILKRIPADTLGFLSSQNLAADWKSLLALMKQTPDFEAQVEDLGSVIGLKIDEELLGWLTGEFAIAVVEARNQEMEELSLGGFAVFEIEDQQEAENVLENIARVLEESVYLSFQERVIGGVEMQVLLDPYTDEITLGYGFTSGHLVIGVTEDALEQAVADDFRSIAVDETFKKVQAHLPSEAGGYLYSNIEAGWRLAYESMSTWEQQDFDESVRPTVEPFKAIGIAAVPTDPRKGIIQRTIFVYTFRE